MEILTEKPTMFQVPEEFKGDVPHWVQVSLGQYFNEHKPVSSLLRAVLENDLEDVAVHICAGEIWDALPAIVRMLHIAAPVGAYGSDQRVAAWLAPVAPATSLDAPQEDDRGFTDAERAEMMLDDRIERIAREVLLKREIELEAMRQ